MEIRIIFNSVNKNIKTYFIKITKIDDNSTNILIRLILSEIRGRELDIFIKNHLYLNYLDY